VIYSNKTCHPWLITKKPSSLKEEGFLSIPLSFSFHMSDMILLEVLTNIFLPSEANRLIQSNYPIISSFCDRENELRYWEIKGF